MLTKPAPLCGLLVKLAIINDQHKPIIDKDTILARSERRSEFFLPSFLTSSRISLITLLVSLPPSRMPLPYGFEVILSSRKKMTS